MITEKNIKQIREIYKRKGDLNDFPVLKKTLFQKYYPQLNFQEFKHSTIWFSCVWCDYCGDLFGSENTAECDDGVLMIFSDSPGPVG